MPKASPSDPREAALAEIEKRYGKGTVMRLGDQERVPVEVIDTGSIGLNRALGIGGFPRGRIVEIYGPESSGKSSVALSAAANAQRAGGGVFLIDAEHAFDPIWGAVLGVDVGADVEGGPSHRGGSLYVNQPDNAEQGLEVAEALIRSGTFRLGIIDSVAALVPRAEIEGDMGDSHVGLQARLMSQALRKLTGACASTGTCLIFINQLREKIGVMFGSAETTSGGKALKFYASIRLDVRRIETLKDGGDAIGSRVRFKVVKDKLAQPFRTAEVDFLFGQGFSREGEILDFGVTSGVIRKAGAWYNHDGDQIGMGKDNARKFLREHPDTAAAIEAKIILFLDDGVKTPAPPVVPADLTSPFDAVAT